MKKPPYWTEACKTLSKKDKVMAKLIDSYSDKTLTTYQDPFKTLSNAIVGQQISIAAADAIWSRVLDLFPNKKIKPDTLLKISETKLRKTGLSKQKILYLQNIAKHFKVNKINNKYFSQKSSEEIAEELLAIKGIGKWTLEMFQIFYLNEEDVFPLGDIGLVKAIKNNYPRAKLENKESIEKFSQRWSPHRTLATWYLWRTIDEDPVHY